MTRLLCSRHTLSSSCILLLFQRFQKDDSWGIWTFHFAAVSVGKRPLIYYSRATLKIRIKKRSWVWRGKRLKAFWGFCAVFSPEHNPVAYWLLLWIFQADKRVEKNCIWWYFNVFNLILYNFSFQIFPKKIPTKNDLIYFYSQTSIRSNALR